MTRRSALVVAGAAGVLVSAYVHFYLYFEGGYRGIHPERFAGVDISRSFALNAIAGLLIAELLVVSLRVPRLATVATLAGMAFAAAALLGYLLSRTTGLLGFTEHQTTVEAVVAKLAELMAIAALALSLMPTRETERHPAADPT